MAEYRVSLLVKPWSCGSQRYGVPAPRPAQVIQVAPPATDLPSSPAPPTPRQAGTQTSDERMLIWQLRPPNLQQPIDWRCGAIVMVSKLFPEPRFHLFEMTVDSALSIRISQGDQYSVGPQLSHCVLGMPRNLMTNYYKSRVGGDLVALFGFLFFVFYFVALSRRWNEVE